MSEPPEAPEAPGPSEQEARAFADAFRRVAEWAGAQGESSVNEVVAMVREHLGPDPLARSVVSRDLPPFEHVNLQAAVDAWSARPGRVVQVRGVSMPPHYGGAGLQQIVSGDALPPLRITAPQLVDLPSGPGGRTLACLQTALLLVEDAAGRYVVMVRGPDRHRDRQLGVDVAGLDVEQAQAVHAELGRLRSQLNVYRGQVLELVGGQDGGLQLVFLDVPATAREDVVLPEDVLRRIERHTIDVLAHRDRLLAAGQHLKRGLLLFGPPGTGKTHTARYVIGQMRGFTVLVLAGRALHMIGSLAELARDLQPTMVVLEDVDLVAMDRGFGPGSNPVLFELLDTMDGAAADADLVFLLTTNRADLLEPALAARPGRVDVAQEIPLPDGDARRRLFTLYGRQVPLELRADEVDVVVARTDGTTASFLRELVRRSVLEALTQDPALRAVTAAHVGAALDDLLDSRQHITRVLLGAADATVGDGGAPPQTIV